MDIRQRTRFQFQLLEMGFDLKSINRLLKIHNEQHISVYVHMLTKEKGSFLHNYVNLKANENCYICGEPEENHKKQPKYVLPYKLKYISKHTEELEDEENQNLNQVSAVYESSLLEESTVNQNLVNKEESAEIKIMPDLRRANSNIVRETRFENSGVNDYFAMANKSFNNIKKSVASNILSNDNNKKIINESIIIILDCGICLGEITDKFEIPRCNHHFCSECLKEYLKEKAKTSASGSTIKCPTEKCENPIENLILRKFLSEEEILKLDKFEKRRNILNNPDAVFCPIPDCESYVIKQEKSQDGNKFVKCVDNSHEFCLNCMSKAHQGKDCLKDTEAIEKWEKQNKQNVRKCPKCGYFIEKTEGCNHMTCNNTACRYQFCWICLGEYDKNHYSNPASPCFGLGNTNNNSILATSSFARALKCILFPILIFLLALIVPFFLSFILIIVVFANYRLDRVILTKFRSKISWIFSVFCIVFSLGTVFLVPAILFLVLGTVVIIPTTIGFYVFDVLMKKSFKRNSELNNAGNRPAEMINVVDLENNRFQAFEFQRLERRNNRNRIFRDNLMEVTLDVQDNLQMREEAKIDIMET